MNCHKVISLLSAYMDRELTGTEMLGIRRHLAECEECSTEYESLLGAKRLLSSLCYARPRAGFVDEICARLDSVQIPFYQRLMNQAITYGRTKLSPIAVGCVALGAMMVFLASSSVKQPDAMALTIPPALMGGITLPSTDIALISKMTPPEEKPRPMIDPPVQSANQPMLTLASYNAMR